MPPFPAEKLYPKEQALVDLVAAERLQGRRVHGFDAYGDDGDDLMLALARKMVGGEEGADSVELVFGQAQQVAAEAEALPGRRRKAWVGADRVRCRRGGAPQ